MLHAIHINLIPTHQKPPNSLPNQIIQKQHIGIIIELVNYKALNTESTFEQNLFCRFIRTTVCRHGVFSALKHANLFDSVVRTLILLR